MSEVIRYLCIARVNGADRVFLWEGEDPGPARVVLDEEGFIRSFTTSTAARDAAAAQGWDVSSEDPAVYDLDGIERWCQSSADVRDCSELLNAWNLFVDLPSDETLFPAADARALGVYDKLFGGCNLPSMTPPGEHYDPAWTLAETAALKQVLLLGLAEFRARLR
jgi:hypothetical protein